MRLAIATFLIVTSSAASAQWKLVSDTDKMSGKNVTMATATSSDSLDLPFPYAGTNKGTLIVRQHPAHGLDVIFTIQKGQLVCGVSGCSIMLRFDDAAPAKFTAVGPTDGSSQTLFLNDTKRFLAQAKNAKAILVQATYFQAGNRVLTFQTPGGLAMPGKP